MYILLGTGAFHFRCTRFMTTPGVRLACRSHSNGVAALSRHCENYSDWVIALSRHCENRSDWVIALSRHCENHSDETDIKIAPISKFTASHAIPVSRCHSSRLGLQHRASSVNPQHKMHLHLIEYKRRCISVIEVFYK